MKTNTSKTIRSKWPLGFLSIVIILGTFFYFTTTKSEKKANIKDLKDPNIAFIETQKALLLLSSNLNIGMESVRHINEFDKSKKLIFK